MPEPLALVAVLAGIFLVSVAVGFLLPGGQPARRLLCWLRGHRWRDISPVDPRELTVRGTRELLAAGPHERRVLAMRWLRCARCGGVAIRG